MRLPSAARRWTAVVVALAALTAACTSHGEAAVAPKTVARANTPATPQDTIRTFAAIGVATVKDETSTTPLAPVTGTPVLTVTEWQVRNMTQEAAAHGGYLGSDLDAMLPMGQAPPFAFIIAGWITAASDPTELAAGRIMGTQDWYHAQDVVFPIEVLDLFAADLLAHSGTSSPGTTPSGTAAGATRGLAEDATYRVGAAGPVEAADLTSCSGIASFVDGVLDNIFNMLKVSPQEVSDWISGKLGGGTLGAVAGAIGGFLASFWNHAVDLAEQALKNVLAALTAPVINTLRTVIGALETITTVVSYLRRWAAPITPEPASNKFSITGQAPITGAFTLKIDKNSEAQDWPALLTDCAATLGKPVPTLSKQGLPVMWTVGAQAGLITLNEGTGTAYTGALDADLSNRVDYTTGSEDAKTAKTGTLVTPTVTVTAHARRTEIDQLADLLMGYLTQNFPPIIQPTVRAILGSLFDWAKAKLDSISSVDGSTTIVVSHHVPKQPSPSPTPSTSCSGSGVAIPAGTYVGTASGTVTTVLHISFDGQTVPNAGSGTQSVSGKIRIVSNGRTVSGSITMGGSGTSAVGVAPGPQFHGKSAGSLKGTISGPASSPVINGSVGGTWVSESPLGEQSGHTGNAIHAGLHVTSASCSAVSGSVVALFQELEKPVAQYLTVGGTGSWTATRS